MSRLNRYETTPRSGISTARYVLHFLAPKLRQRELLRLPDVKDLVPHLRTKSGAVFEQRRSALCGRDG